MVEPLNLEELAMQAGIWQIGEEITLASGEISNHHFDMPLILESPEAREPFLQALAGLAMQREPDDEPDNKPDGLWGVPTGGQRFAEELGKLLGLKVIKLEAIPDKDPAYDRWTKLFRYASPQDKELAEDCQRLVGIEDLTTQLTSLLKALSSNRDIADKTVALVAGLRRGTSERERWFAIPVRWAIENEEPLPNIITPDNPFYRRYSKYARHEES